MTNWEDKLTAFLHDPPSKALNIPGHEGLSDKLREVWYIAKGDDALYDQISASADRPGVPGHKEGCSVDFVEIPELTHPISAGRLRLNLTVAKPDIATLEEYLVKTLKGMALSENDTNKSKFFTLFEGLKQALSQNEHTFYSIWNKMPADTRIPDHSIWHHNSLVSALSACKNAPYFFVFSLGPVQGFISEARKLRDLWVGSMILSYLAWVGIRVICDDFGPDHIVYPSLSGQPFFSEYIQERGLSELVESIEPDQKKIASFPNKFVAILPKDSVTDEGKRIEEAILSEWKLIADSVYQRASMRAASNLEYFKQAWERQNSRLWECYWLASPWFKTLDDNLAKGLPESDKTNINKLVKLFQEASGYPVNQGICYSPSHGIVQALHAALKNSRRFQEGYREPGDKCTQCGTRQQLSTSENRGDTRAFWKHMKEGIGDDIRDGERLCSVCLIKRIVGRGSQGLPPTLGNVFKNASFPSSTAMAFDPIVRKLKKLAKSEIWNDFVSECGGDEKPYNILHDNDDKDHPDEKVSRFLRRLRVEAGIKPTNIFGKYYAVLLMDGDKMGDLVNGKADKLATWQDIMHSSLPEKLRESKSKERTRGWLEQGILQKKRHLTPSVHKAISEALGDFALNTVPYVIKRHHGHLIYAGGDDVLAVMPIDTVLRAAEEIMELYRAPFLVKRFEETDWRVKKCNGEYTPEKGEKLLIHLGEAATISAAVIIAHHKAPLKGVIHEAHQVLEKEAKDGADRDAVAILLKKRGGAEKLVAKKWKNDGDAAYIALLTELVKALCDYDQKASSKLMYKIEQNKTALETLVKEGPEGSVEKFLESLIEKGQRNKDKNNGKWEQERATLAKRLKAILLDKDSTLKMDGLMIARFLAQAIGGE
ncbi:MAG: CRISPR-associated protein [Syntrophorhabdus sp. PtaU1.Bin153]|nr:MAG: CRISPR-associated protein [Syntrophorhabdus sp. PtaU1.Bin153]